MLKFNVAYSPIFAVLTAAVFVSGCDNSRITTAKTKNNKVDFSKLSSENSVAYVSEVSGILMAGHGLADMGSAHLKAALTPATATAAKPDILAQPISAVVFQKTLSTLDDPQVFLAAQATATGTIVEMTMAECTAGTMKMQLNDLNQDQKASSGDEITFVFTNCNDGMMTMNGRVTVKNFVLTGTPVVNTPQPWSFSGTFSYDAFTSVSSGKTTTTNGDIGVTWGLSANGKEFGSINFKNLDFVTGTDNVTFQNVAMTLDVTTTGQTKSTVMTMNGDFTHSRLGATKVSISTDSANKIVIKSGSPHPVSGNLVVTRPVSANENGATIALETSSSGSVSLKVTDTATNEAKMVTTSWSNIHSAMGGGTMTTSPGTSTGGSPHVH